MRSEAWNEMAASITPLLYIVGMERIALHVKSQDSRSLNVWSKDVGGNQLRPIRKIVIGSDSASPLRSGRNPAAKKINFLRSQRSPRDVKVARAHLSNFVSTFRLGFILPPLKLASLSGPCGFEFVVRFLLSPFRKRHFSN